MSANMNTDAVEQAMLSQNLISSEISVMSSSVYQTNCLMLETFRMMSLDQLEHFLCTTENSNVINVTLFQGKYVYFDNIAVVCLL